MTNVATLRVLKQVFTAAVGFSASQLSSQREAIKSAAQAEGASDDMLWTDDAGLTPGMNAHCIQPAAQALSAWTGDIYVLSATDVMLSCSTLDV